MKRLRLFSLCFVTIFVFSGCTNVPKRELTTVIPPYVMLPNGDIPLQPGVKSRVMLDSSSAIIKKLKTNKNESLDILQLSGGGQNGAFGAGILNGWSETGLRPEFDIVTGVSTGSLIATFAFPGTPEDNKLLRDMWLSIERKNIYIKRGVSRILVGKSSLYDTKPLQELVARIITPDTLNRVAHEYDEGRRLYVSTVNIDYNQTWVWDLSAIAKHAGDEALELYRKVILASSSPPILFPPVEINGFLFVDGGARHNILIVGLAESREAIVDAVGEGFRGEDLKGRVYVILHHKSDYVHNAVRADVKDLLSRAAHITIETSTTDSVLRSYFIAKLQGLDFYIVHLPNELDIGDNSLAFEPDAMQRMYEKGRAIATGDKPWKNKPDPTGEISPWLMDEVVKRFENSY